MHYEDAFRCVEHGVHFNGTVSQDTLGIKSFENHQRINREYLCKIIYLQKNYSSHDPIPLKPESDLTLAKEVP
jgi:hypothetical protein